MEVTLRDVQKKFDALISGTESREQVANFATRAIEADDDGLLEVERAYYLQIWEAIIYLSGVDLMHMPGQYLHSVSDFIAARKDLGVK